MKNYPIIRSLMFWLGLTISVVTFIGTTIFVFTASKKGRIELEIEADKTISHLASILSRPLWDYDIKRTIIAGESYSKDPRILQLTISDDKSVLFSFDRKETADSTHRARKIVHEGKILGEVQIAFSRAPYLQSIKQMVKAVIIIFGLVLIAIFITTGFLIRTFLRKPLRRMAEIVNAYAANEYADPPQVIPYREFQPFGAVLSQMGEKIKTQLDDLRALNKQLLQEKNFSDAFINSLPGIFYVYDDQLRLIRWNKNHEEVTGFAHEELHHKHLLFWYDEKTQPLVYKAVEKVFKEGEASLEAEPRFKGVAVPYLLTGTVLRAEGKQYLIGVGTDISQRKQLEEELFQAQKMEAIGTLAGGIAHDFNNILSAIYGYSQLAEEDIHDPELLKKDIRETLKATVRAKELVKQILTFSRKTEHEKQPLQISVVVKEALKLLRPSIPSTIEIKKDISSDAVTHADPTKIHQIIMNLCTNAYHAMRDTGGVLSVSLKEVDFRMDKMISEPEIVPGKYVLLEVNDTGIGMDAETKQKIFEPYFTAKNPGEGTGLGLAVVHGIVKDHQGYIHVYSEPNQGTSFHIYFPIIVEEPLDYTIGEGESHIKGGSERVMVIDDEVQIIDLTKKVLSRQGYKVTTFTNGVQALQEIKKQPDKVDLIITDLTMPYMTGIELTKEILSLNPRLPIILTSGLSEALNKEKAKGVGVKEYCEKPVEAKHLLRTVRKLLDERDVE